MRPGLLLVAALALAPWNSAHAQRPVPVTPPPGRRACDGDTVTALTIREHRPSSVGFAAEVSQTTYDALPLPHVTTRDQIVRSYMRLDPGDVCTELRRSESERLLRAQPFIASATVLATPGAPGHVTVQVEVVDELPFLVGANTGRGTLSALTLGMQNIDGRALAVVASGERGFAYRDGLGFRVTKYAMFGGPDLLSVYWSRNPLGDATSLELGQPFLTDLQRRAYHVSTALTSDYYGLVRPAGADISLYVRRTSYDVGWVTRLGHTSGRGIVGLVGGALIGEDVRTGQSAVFVTDTGLVPIIDDPLGSTYHPYASMRVAAIGGLRALRFITVRGFDALRAEEDRGIGVQFDVLAGPSVWASRNAQDLFLAGDLYAGMGDARSFVVVRAQAEARGERETRSWDGLVASTRFAWYGKPTSLRSELVSVEFSGVQKLVFPIQLTFRDAEGGLPGFGGASLAGGQRAVVRMEERRLIRLFGSHADFAGGVFADAGKLWAGDVPYGQTTNVRASAGISLYGTYPSGGKRVYRVDLAFPVNPDAGGQRFEVRVTSSDRTRLLWTEPSDVARARTGAVPVNLMKW